MKQEKMNFAHISRTVLWLGLIVVCIGLTAARAQVTPTVCFEPKPETFTRTATNDFNNTFNFINLNQAVPHGFYSIVINPGGATEERLTYVRTSSQTLIHPGGTGLPGQTFQFNHLAGETLLLTAEGDAVFGYKNSSSTAVTIPRGVSSSNYFAPGSLVYISQPTVFQPGVRENAISIKVLAAFPVTWTLNNQQAASNTTQECATITYQGRLSDAGNAANGQFDLQFQAFDTETGGAAQSGIITLENVQVTNGIFTVPLKFGASLTNNFKARFLEIGVRPGGGSGNDPFSTLTPRQPITSVPYAVNAHTAATATNAANAEQLGNVAANQYVLTTDPRLSATNNTNFIQNSTTQQTANFSINGNGTIGGTLTVSGAINGTVTNATNAQNAVNATNAAQLGGAAASQYFRSAGGIVSGNLQANGDIAVGNDLFVARNTTTSGSLTVGGTINAAFGQNVTTAFGASRLQIDTATTAYTLVPELTQTVNVPANSALFISTDGGIQSTGTAINSYSVIDVAIFVDGALVRQRRIVIVNNPLPSSVGNWSLSTGQTLAAGSHTIEVRVRNGGIAGSTSAVVGGDSLLNGQLTVAVIRK